MTLRFIGEEPPVNRNNFRHHSNQWSDHLYIIFNDVKSTFDTYTIDVFLNYSQPQPKDIADNNPFYVGRDIRWGREDAKGQRQKSKIGRTRFLDASYNAYCLGLTPETKLTLSVIVTLAKTGEIISLDRYSGLSGFAPVYLWSKGRPGQGHPRSTWVEVRTVPPAPTFAGDKD